MQYQKVKSVAKRVEPRGERLRQIVLDTLDKISRVVGSTLGPGGQVVLIERFEHDLPPIITKDGVTVFRAMGFEDSIQQVVMETARDVAVRTATEAGDGTTTATILGAAMAHHADAFCRRNPKYSPQRVVRAMERCFKERIEPMLREMAIKADPSTEEGHRILKAVATVSANGDVDLADAVMECFTLCGDEGNVTILEQSGPSQYVVEKVEGFPIPGAGWEESARTFYPKFLNESQTQRAYLEGPLFLLYHGKVTDWAQVLPALITIGNLFERNEAPQNVVLFANSFSDSALGALATNFANPSSIHVLPVQLPVGSIINNQLQTLEDIAAVTGATILDPLNKPFESVTMEDTGAVYVESEDDDKPGRWAPQVRAFECGRYRSTIFGKAQEGDLCILRTDELRQALGVAESQMQAKDLQERIARLSGGIARLRVIGASNGETKEKRDRAEDAVCAVRGAIKHGALPGGSWALLKVAAELTSDDIDGPVENVMRNALCEPFGRLMENIGVPMRSEEFYNIMRPIAEGIQGKGPQVVYDALRLKHVDAVETGLLDSLPAVLEAVRSAVSIMQLGTLGGAVVFVRDHELERREATDTQNFLRSASDNPANERSY